MVLKHPITSSCFTLLSLSPLSYAFPGVVTVTSLQRWYQKLWIWGLLEPPADIARVLLLPVLPVSVPLLTAGFRSLGLSHCVLAGVPSSTNASPLWSTGPVCSCGCECIISTFKTRAKVIITGVCRGVWHSGFITGRSQLQAVGSSQRWLTAGVLLRRHQDVLRHVPERPEDRRWRHVHDAFSLNFIPHLIHVFHQGRG